MEMGTTKCIRYKGVQSKKVESDFSGGSITSDAGVMLLRRPINRQNSSRK